MKSASSLLTLFISCSSVIAQAPRAVAQKDLVGLWQAGSPVVGSGFVQIYRFFKDGRFTFGFSQFTEPKKYLELHGTYSIKGGQIVFRVTHRTDLAGGEIVRGGPPADGEWVLEGGKPITVKQSGKPEDPVEIKFIATKESKQVAISIEGHKYFKISNDPHNQE